MKQIFYHGTILTMEANRETEAVLIHEDTIEKTGTFEEVRAMAPDAELIDLKDKTMIPAFLDAHGHFSSYANAQLQVSLEEAVDVREITERIHAFMENNKIGAGQWIVAKGYDHNMLTEQSHPSREVLDEIAPDHPLVLQHQSGHCGVFNTMALTCLALTPQTPVPAGGVIECVDGKLTGYMEETAYIQYVKKVPMADLDTMLAAYRKAQNNYFAYGITTAQEGMMVTQMLPLYQCLLESGLLTIDVIGYPDMTSMKAIANAFPKAKHAYDRHFKIGGYKIILDGSPQVKTAWMQAPYLGSDTYCGYGTMSDEEVLAAIDTATSEGQQILAHANGDAAIQQYIDAVSKEAEKNKNVIQLKPVIIHSQFITHKQLEKVKEFHMIPSFFLAHVLHWGDTHSKNFGYERAQSISPAKEALNQEIPFTFHQDAPVIEPNMLETIQCAVNRTTKQGCVLGEQECIDVYDALKAVTINAAYQYSEETCKGSIKEGKQADFVILSDNPLTVPKDKIANITIMETRKAGNIVFQREG